ncbi:MAG: hypothetical protein AB7Q27_20980, partial [Acidimicrobiia bacterium]
MTIPDSDSASAVVALATSVDGPVPGDRDGLVARLGEVERLLAWVHARKLAVVRELARVSSVAEGDVAAVCRVTMGAADRMVQQARQLDGVPGVAEALTDGSITAAHAEVLAASLRAQDPAVSRVMRSRVDELIDAAKAKSVESFRRHLASVSREIREGLGISRVGRQRHDTRCRTWVDKETGMWHLAGAFDPTLAVEMIPQLDAVLAQLYALAVPEHCPVDPIAKQDHLRALALAAIVTGKLPNGDRLPVRAGGVDISVVVDVTKETVEIDWGSGLEVPVEFLIDLLSRPGTKIHGIAVRDGVVVWAPGRLDCGRESRLANRAQRRALRAMYKTCAIGGCEVEFDHCDAHHIHPWEHGGTSDL